MNLQERLTACIQEAVDHQEAAGINLLIWRDGKEIAYGEAGFANCASRTPIRRDSIFRLYSQTKPITAAAVMLLVERGQLDLMEGVDRFLPGFRNPKIVDADGQLRDAPRAPWMDELLAMTAGVCYPDADPAGQFAARVFEAQQERMTQGDAWDTVTFCNRLGEQPLAFQPGTHWRYSTCADILGAVVEVVSGMPFGEFLRREFFEPLGMKDTGFWVPPEKRNRLVTCYERTAEGLREFHRLHLAVGQYDAPPAFESGGAGLVSTLDDYMAFGQMLLGGGVWRGKRVLSEASVRHLTAPQLSESLRGDLWDSIQGYNYGHLLRICDRPGSASFFAMAHEYSWDGWLGSYFANLPDQGITFLLNENTTNTGTANVTRKCRNLLAAAL